VIVAKDVSVSEISDQGRGSVVVTIPVGRIPRGQYEARMSLSNHAGTAVRVQPVTIDE